MSDRMSGQAAYIGQDVRTSRRDCWGLIHLLVQGDDACCAFVMPPFTFAMLFINCHRDLNVCIFSCCSRILVAPRLIVACCAHAALEKPSPCLPCNGGSYGIPDLDFGQAGFGRLGVPKPKNHKLFRNVCFVKLCSWPDLFSRTRGSTCKNVVFDGSVGAAGAGSSNHVPEDSSG